MWVVRSRPRARSCGCVGVRAIDNALYRIIKKTHALEVYSPPCFMRRFIVSRKTLLRRGTTRFPAAARRQYRRIGIAPPPPERRRNLEMYVGRLALRRRVGNEQPIRDESARDEDENREKFIDAAGHGVWTWNENCKFRRRVS